MRNNKRGLSTVVSTLIIILLVLAAIGIIWVVIRNVVEQGSEEVQSGADCISIRLQINEDTVTTTKVNVQRVGGGGDVWGIKTSMIDEFGKTCVGESPEGTVEVLDIVAIDWDSGCGASGDSTVSAAAILPDGTICNPSDEIEVEIT